MKIEARVFGLLAGFLIVTAVIYWFLSEDPTGTTLIAICSGLGLMIGYYLWFTARRFDGVRPEDRLDANIEDGAGEIGFFPPHSWWPFALAVGSALFCLGFVIGMWLLIAGAVVTVWAVSGLVLEYYSGLSDDMVPPTSG